MRVAVGTDPSTIVNPRAPFAHLFTPEGALTPEATSPDNLAEVPAAITRAQWDDYVKRFQPFEDDLLNQTHYENPAIVGQEINKALPRVDAAINTGRATQAHRLQALGQRVTAPMQSEIDKTWSSERTLARVDAANRIRQNIAERSRNIAFGGGGSPTSAITPTGGA